MWPAVISRPFNRGGGTTSVTGGTGSHDDVVSQAGAPGSNNAPSD
jgi:hypothetical protein